MQKFYFSMANNAKRIIERPLTRKPQFASSSLAQAASHASLRGILASAFSSLASAFSASMHSADLSTVAVELAVVVATVVVVLVVVVTPRSGPHVGPSQLS